MLRSIPQYVAEFKAVFGHDKLTIDEVTSAIAAFEETLVTPNARFDKWLQGDQTAIDAQELRGYELFKSSGCIACHNGPNVGGASFQKMGLIEAYKTTSTAEGRFAVTKQDIDRFHFKVPTLRNVELTYPYFHDGAADTLAQAVDTMGRLQLGRKFSEAEIADVVAFLKTLTGEQPGSCCRSCRRRATRPSGLSLSTEPRGRPGQNLAGHRGPRPALRSSSRGRRRR